jgi:hypothetical protein
MHHTDTGSNVDVPGIPLEAQRLKRKRTREAADQSMRADTATDRGARRASNVVTLQRTSSDIAGGCDNRPHNRGASRVTDIDTELRHPAHISVRSADALIVAVHLLRRSEDITPTTLDAAVQCSDFNAAGVCIGSGGKYCGAKCKDAGYPSIGLTHNELLSVAGRHSRSESECDRSRKHNAQARFSFPGSGKIHLFRDELTLPCPSYGKHGMLFRNETKGETPQ